jgi:hypothetical protein
METPKEYYYTYYSYEEWGRGYIGSRKCYYLPEEDVNYLGSSKDKTFKPTQKIILKDDYATREEAYADEIILQKYYRVVENPHFANRSYQTSTKFYVPKEQAVENGKKTHELGVGIHALTKEQRIEHGRKSHELGLGAHALTKEQMSENGRKSGEKVYKLGLGVHALTKEQRIENGKKVYKLGLGVHGRTKEQMRENGTKSYELGLGCHSLTKEQKSEVGKKTASQKWKCTETGHITNAAALTRYQRKRGIDTTKRMRIE